MKILFTIAHYFKQEPNGKYGHQRQDSQARLNALVNN